VKGIIKMFLLFLVLFFPVPLTVVVFGGWFNIVNTFICIFWVVLVFSLLDFFWGSSVESNDSK
jgi:hypothetical protein